MLKVGTVQEVENLAFKNKVSNEVYQEALRIVKMLDENFGDDRDIDQDDGGIVLVIENAEDLSDFSKNYVELESPLREYIELVYAEKEPYLNVFFLYNEYEFGITLLIPKSIAPEIYLQAFIHESIKA